MTEIADVQGIVTQANEHGIQLNNSGTWFNYSKWGDQPPLPPLGAQVVVGVDAKGFLRKVTVFAPGGGAPAAAPPIQTTAAPSNGSAPIAPQPRQHASFDETRGPVISRLTSLKAAVEFANARAAVTGDTAGSTDVLRIAALWATWAESGKLPEVRDLARESAPTHVQSLTARTPVDATPAGQVDIAPHDDLAERGTLERRWGSVYNRASALFSAGRMPVPPSLILSQVTDDALVNACAILEAAVDALEAAA